MKGSFGGSYGLGRNSGSFNGGGGGGGGGGDGVLRTIGRVMRTRINGVQDPFQSSSSSNSISSNSKRSSTPPKNRGSNSNSNNGSKNGLILSSNQSSSSSSNNGGQFPVSAVWSSCPYVVEEPSNNGNDNGIDDGWECFEDFYDPVFGLVPSNHEVQNAIFSVQQFIEPGEMVDNVDGDMGGQITTATNVLRRTSSSSGSDVDWVEPSMQLYNRRLARSYGWEMVYDAFHLLQTEPSVQKMVVSLSSDKAVWDAVLNNETVREIRDLYLKAAESESSYLNPDDRSDATKESSNVLKWIMEHVKGKLMEVVGNITQFVGGIFKPLNNPDKAEESVAFSDKLKSSFLLTVLVLLIVVVTRGRKA